MDTLIHCGEQSAPGLHTLGRERAGKLKPSTYFAFSPNYFYLYFQETFSMSGGENDNLCREA